VSAGVAPESWEQWTSRVAGELADLAEGEWLTLTAASTAASGPHPSSHGTDPPVARSPERARRWSLRRDSSTRAGNGRDSRGDVFVQARRLDGVLALECISDTEFEGLSDLTAQQQQALVALGWEPDEPGPSLHRSYPRADADSAPEAATLLRDSLRQVLGHPSPDDLVLRRSPRPSPPAEGPSPSR
jgi:hypothetical protein